LLKQKRRLRKLWQETRDPACKAAYNRVANSIRRLTRRKAFERWENKIGNCELTPQAIWPIAKSLMNRDRPRAPTVIYGPTGLKFHPLEKANAIANCLENQFAPHDLCDYNQERRVEARVQALLKTVDNSPPERVRPCDCNVGMAFVAHPLLLGLPLSPPPCPPLLFSLPLSNRSWPRERPRLLAKGLGFYLRTCPHLSALNWFFMYSFG
jgi:hypothetical protein